MCGTILLSVLQNCFLRLTGTTSLHMDLETQVLFVTLSVTYLSHVSQISRVGHADGLTPCNRHVTRWFRQPHHASWPCELSCACVRPYTLPMVRLSDQVSKVAPGWLPEGLAVVSGSNERVRHQSDGCWPISFFAVHWSHVWLASHIACV